MELRGNVSFVVDSFLACVAFAADAPPGLPGGASHTRSSSAKPNRVRTRSRGMSLVAGAVALATVMAMPAREARADFISDTLATAGPSNYAILFMSTAGNPHINGPAPDGTTGNVGFDVAGNTFNLDSPSSINGKRLSGRQRQHVRQYRDPQWQCCLCQSKCQARPG